MNNKCTTVFIVLFSLQLFGFEPVRRVVVFPMLIEGVPDSILLQNWWKIRSVLTKDQKFLVASYNFLKTKKVLQPRAELSSADVLLLGRLLLTDCIVVVFKSGNNLNLKAYDARAGLLLFEKSIVFNASSPVEKQVEAASMRLIKDFIGSVPYDGYVSQVDADEITIFSGLGHGFRVSDSVEFIDLSRGGDGALFNDNYKVKVLYVAEVSSVGRDSVKVRLNAGVDSQSVSEGLLIRQVNTMSKVITGGNSVANKTNQGNNPMVWGFILLTLSLLVF